MDRKQREGLVIALHEKGKTYREITREARVSPNTIKAVLNKARLDQSTPISSRVFQLFSEGKTPLQVAITLGLKADEAINYHQEYFMLLGCTEFTKVYLQVKNNSWAYVNLVKLTQNSGIGDSEVEEIVKIAKGYLPSVRIEYDQLKAELNLLKADISNSVRIYQQFTDRIIDMNKRVNELQLTIKDKEDAIAELDSRLERSQLEHQENQSRDEVIPMNDVLIPKYFIALFSDYIVSDPLGFSTLYTIIFTAVAPIGGFLFGLAFWISVRNVGSRAVKDYLFISGCGLLLFFSANQAILLTSFPYPPFGATIICYFGLSSYLIFIGIHSSAISVAQDKPAHSRYDMIYL
jgi:predicted transcriptional regulator